MGNVLADYEDAGGIVVVANAAWDLTGGWNLQGRWMTDGYSPYNSTDRQNFSYSRIASNGCLLARPGCDRQKLA